MKYTVKTDAELAAAGLLPAGVYDFEVKDAIDTQSKSGNDMIKLTLEVFTPEGGHRVFTDYLLDKMFFKLKHFFDTIGLSSSYQAGEISANQLAGRSGKLRIKIKAAEGNFAEKNEVADYVVPKVGIEVAKPSAPVTVQDDSVPF